MIKIKNRTCSNNKQPSLLLRKEALDVFIIVIINCLLMAISEMVFSANYMQRSIIKIAIFMLVPLFYLKKHNSLGEFKALLKITKGSYSIFKSLALGLGVYILILGAYFTIGNYFDFGQITTSLETGIGVDCNNFIFVALYISFFNSLLEEFFFRGYVFIYLKKHTTKKIAYIFSSLAFALYHITIMITWFDFTLIALLTFSLFVAGLIFDYLDDNSGTIYNSWFVHMFANFSINTIGFILFGIIKIPI